ncbi:MAG: dephospho-CoA kinase [Defluviitaleaceae bacterium]|nr:dephospho-CoA kinase [Defluviitaleaceae bacterium]
MKIVGLTGGIATGKSTVSQMLAKRGYAIIDADAVVHDLQVKGSPLLQEISSVFGSTILTEDGSLNRKALGQLIFADQTARQQLNAIVHPAVWTEFQKRIAESTADVLFLDVPLLFETGFDVLTDVNWVISAPVQVQLSRLMLRDGLTEKEAWARIDSQMAMHQKIERADVVIDNSGDLNELEAKVNLFLGEILR